MKNARTAFSFVELLILVIFVGVLAMISVPRINLGVIDKQRVETAAHKLMIDLRRTRRLAISDAAANPDGYGLVLKGAGPYSGYEIWNRKGPTRVDALQFDSCIACTADGRNFNFGPTGSLLTGGGTTIRLTSRGRSFVVTVIPATGMVKCAEQ